MDKNKISQIYETMADITLSRLNEIKEAETQFSENEITMVSATLNLYNTIVRIFPQELFSE